jgi:hypothetical protein
LPPLPLSKHEGKREGSFKGERKAQVSARYGVVSDMNNVKSSWLLVLLEVNTIYIVYVLVLVSIYIHIIICERKMRFFMLLDL